MRYSPFGYWGRQIGAILFAVLAIVLVIWVIPPSYLALKGVLLAAISTSAIVIALSAYRKADEVILQTHKDAWFWGCMAAMAALAPLSIAILTGLMPLPRLLPFPHRPADHFADGVVFVLLLECAGFLVLWAWYNLRRRG